MSDNQETTPEPVPFDFSAYPWDTVFHERRTGKDRRERLDAAGQPIEKREKKPRRGKIDPTTFDKSYTPDEIEFMNAMQRYKVMSGKPFPSYREMLDVAYELGYRRVIAHHDESQPTAYLVTCVVSDTQNKGELN